MKCIAGVKTVVVNVSIGRCNLCLDAAKNINCGELELEGSRLNVSQYLPPPNQASSHLPVYHPRLHPFSC